MIQQSNKVSFDFITKWDTCGTFPSDRVLRLEHNFLFISYQTWVCYGNASGL